MTATDLRVDVAVVGGGPAGIAASVSAADAGARVALIDEGLGPGGQIWRPGIHAVPGRDARHWTDRLAASAATTLSMTSVVDVHRRELGGFVVVGERSGAPVRVVAKTLVIATGARERFVPFPGWTLPGVVGVGGAQALLKSGTSFRGRRVVVAGSGPLLLPVAASLARAGARLALVAEQAAGASVAGFAASLWRTPGMLMQAAALRAAFIGTAYRTGTWVAAAMGDAEAGVRSVMVTNGRRSWTIACDVLCVAFGLTPNTELARLMGCARNERGVVVDDRQGTTVTGVFCAGEPTGIGGVELSLVEGAIAGRAAAGTSVGTELPRRRASLRHYAVRLENAFRLRDEVRRLADPDTTICRCEDVRLRDLRPEWTARQAKLYTRAGMGACQGRICGAALECVMGWSADSVRVPIQPARLTTLLAGGGATDGTQSRTP